MGSSCARPGVIYDLRYDPSRDQNQNQLSRLVTSLVAALRQVGCVFDPQPDHTKDYSGLDFGELAHPMIPGHGTTAAYSSLRG